MDRSKGALALSSPSVIKLDGPPKQRRRLQKTQRFSLRARSELDPSLEALKLKETKAEAVASRLALPAQQQHQQQPHQQAHQLPHQPLTLPPDLSDSKWSEYLRGDGYLCALDASAQPQNASSIPRIIPEFSHLAISNVKPARSSTETLAVPESPASTASSTMRRRGAKTPVFTIGQLEASIRPPNALAAQLNPGVEVIAEQYRALLVSRNSMLTDSHSEPPPSRGGHEDQEVFDHRRQHSADDLPSHRIGGPQSSAPLSSPGCSPTSDDGTLVAFEEDTIYFKPISFSPEPASPISSLGHSAPTSPQHQPDNISLQICLDLLTRELSSAFTNKPHFAGTEASALQVYVMIEAYERLRDQLLESTQAQGENAGPMEMMFDMWLRALYSIHAKLAGDGRSESDYGMLETEELD